jgi:flagellar hook-basal body complex protein FliE
MSDLSITGAPAAVGPAAIPPTRATREPSATTRSAAGGFGETLGRALAGVNALQLDADAASVALASGKSVDTAKTVVTIEKASIAFQFAMQVRNKLLEAYQEVMRMQV